MLALVRDELPGGDATDDLDHLFHARLARRPLGPGAREILGPRRETDTEPIVRHDRDRRGLFRYEHRLANRRLRDEGGEAQSLGHGAERRDQGEWLDERSASEEVAIPVRVYGYLLSESRG